MRSLLTSLTGPEQETLAALLHEMLLSGEITNLECRGLCPMCGDCICIDCTSPADEPARA